MKVELAKDIMPGAEGVLLHLTIEEAIVIGTIGGCWIGISSTSIRNVGDIDQIYNRFHQKGLTLGISVFESAPEVRQNVLASVNGKAATWRATNGG